MGEGNRSWIVVAVLAAAMLGLWFLYASTPDTGPPVVSDAGPRVARGPVDAAGPADVAPGAASPSPAPAPAPKAPHRTFDSPEAASEFLEERFLEFVAATAPQIDPKSIRMTCEDDGRVCTFDGPWPGDDFLKQWIRAVSDGRTGPDALQGMTFSTFERVEADGGDRMKVVARAP